VGIVFGFLCLIFATACIDVDVNLDFQPDGSGEATVVMAIPPSVPDTAAVAAKVQEQFKGTHWRVVEGKKPDGTLMETATKSFKALSEIGPDLDLSGNVVSRSTGFLRTRTSLDLTSKGGGQFTHYVITISLPGKVLNTNGKCVASDKVRWDLTGRGVTKLVAVSEGLSIPGPTRLFGESRRALAAWMHRLGSSECLLLNDSGRILVVDPLHPGHPGTVVAQSAAAFSCSENGIVAICFQNAGGIKVVSVDDPSVVKASVPGDAIQPCLSRDGTRLAYVRVLRRYSAGDISGLPESVRADISPGAVRASQVVLRDLATGSEIVAPTARTGFGYGFSDLISGWADGSRMLIIHRFPVVGIDEGPPDLWDTFTQQLKPGAGGEELLDGSIFQWGEGMGTVLRPGQKGYRQVQDGNEVLVDEHSVSPDGSMIAFVVERTNRATKSDQMVLRLWSVSSKRSIDLDKLQPYTTSPAGRSFGKLAWTSDSRILAYEVEGRNDHTGELWRVNADGTGRQHIMSGLDFSSGGPMLFVRGSRRLVFAEGATPHTSLETLDVQRPDKIGVLAHDLTLPYSYPNAPLCITTKERLSWRTAHLLSAAIVGMISMLLLVSIAMPLLLVAKRLLAKRRILSTGATLQASNPIARYCEECGAELKPGSRFCKSCGSAVE
jgi:Tol biopolymer transport system component